MLTSLITQLGRIFTQMGEEIQMLAEVVKMKEKKFIGEVLNMKDTQISNCAKS